MIGGYPVAWVLGFSPMLFPFAALLMVVWLIRYRPLQVPVGTLPLAMFLLIVTAFVPSSRLVQSNGAVGDAIVMVSLGLDRLGLPRPSDIAPGPPPHHPVDDHHVGGHDRRWVRRPGPARPQLADSGFTGLARLDRVRSVRPRSCGATNCRSADVLDRRPPRPGRPPPYPYTNAWESSVALLTPFVLASMQDRRIGVPRWLGLCLLAAGLVPFYFALNRGAWLTLAAGFGLRRVAFHVCQIGDRYHF